MEEWRTSRQSIAAGSFKWRADEFYNRAHNKPQHMFAPDWMEGEIKTYRSSGLPTATLRAHSLSSRLGSDGFGQFGAKSLPTSPSRAGGQRPLSVSGSARVSGRTSDMSPSAHSLNGDWGWCLPAKRDDLSLSGSAEYKSGELTPGRRSLSHLPLKETSVWPRTCPPQRMALEA